ncbi:MAG: hypothetical protein EBR55_09835 [Chitinophagia bacterium]|nr:hypothetical protein [Chitinophagia bacterium]
MTPEMHEILYNSVTKPPTSQKDRVKYLVASLTRTVVEDPDYFKYLFFNDIEDFKTLANWVDRKTKGEPFTDDEMFGLKVLNSSGIVYFGLLAFKAISIGIFNKDQFYAVTDTPKPKKNREIPKTRK